MKKAYWIAPLIVLAAFIALYVSSRKDFAAKEANAALEAKRLREEKAAEARRKQEEAQKKRAEEVAAANLKRKQQEEKEEAEKKMFEDLNYKRNFANSEAERLKRVVDDIKKDIDAETKAREEAEKTTAKLKEEKTFLAAYTSKADLNVKNLQAVLEKIEKADREAVRLKEEAAKAAEKKG